MLDGDDSEEVGRAVRELAVRVLRNPVLEILISAVLVSGLVALHRAIIAGLPSEVLSMMAGLYDALAIAIAIRRLTSGRAHQR